MRNKTPAHGRLGTRARARDKPRMRAREIKRRTPFYRRRPTGRRRKQKDVARRSSTATRAREGSYPGLHANEARDLAAAPSMAAAPPLHAVVWDGGKGSREERRKDVAPVHTHAHATAKRGRPICRRRNQKNVARRSSAATRAREDSYHVLHANFSGLVHGSRDSATRGSLGRRRGRTWAGASTLPPPHPGS